MIDVPFHPAARQEYEDALAWFQRHSEQSARGFERAVEEATQAIANAPEWWPIYDGQHRVYIIRRFKYLLLYRPRGAGVEIIAVAHASRRPGYWKGR